MSGSLISTGIIVLGALVIIILERVYPYDKGQPLFRAGFFTDSVMYTLVQSTLLSYAIGGVATLVQTVLPRGSVRILSGFPVWAVVLVSLVEHDFYIYWFHRWQHHNSRLWRIHEAHHSVKEVDWLAGSRAHFFEVLINQSIEYVPLVVLGAPVGAIYAKAAVDAIWGMYIHSNINVRSGKLQRFINGPEMHRWHHDADYSDGGKNFSTKFAVWDWLFGTAYLPPHLKPSGYGIDDPNFPAGYVRQHLYSFRPFDVP